MKHIDIKNILKDNSFVNNEAVVCGWIKSIRNSKNVCFIELNDGTSLKNLQLVIDKEKFDQEQVNSLKVGSSIAVNGTVLESQNENQKVELSVSSLKVIGNCPNDFPIQKKRQNLETLREMPHLRARTNTFNAVFRVRSVLSKAIHDYAKEHGVGVWCGSMLESGIGQAHNLAIASLENYRYSNDIMSSTCYLSDDIIKPQIEIGKDSFITIPEREGIGYDIDEEKLQKYTFKLEHFDF